MKFIVGYDRDMATQCFKRNLRQLIRPVTNPLTGISNDEVDYFSERLAETSIFSYESKLGSPWLTKETADELLNLSARKATRTQLVRCELLANNLLVLEGIIRRSGALKQINHEEIELARTRFNVTSKLYLKAATGSFHNSNEVKVLRDMSKHVSEWVRYLSYLPGNDFMDLLWTLKSHQFYV